MCAGARLSGILCAHTACALLVLQQCLREDDGSVAPIINITIFSIQDHTQPILQRVVPTVAVPLIHNPALTQTQIVPLTRTHISASVKRCAMRATDRTNQITKMTRSCTAEFHTFKVQCFNVSVSTPPRTEFQIHLEWSLHFDINLQQVQRSRVWTGLHNENHNLFEASFRRPRA